MKNTNYLMTLRRDRQVNAGSGWTPLFTVEIIASNPSPNQITQYMGIVGSVPPTDSWVASPLSFVVPPQILSKYKKYKNGYVRK